ncbi:MAG: hypothetical protein A3D31_07395 [Candidatus Fluviicola riflensis]|nr:MAG: hypothetical protein CHH17_07615 [Candidatus Fluviicola riflensis]OGS79771.1 MAG: hypothetical protein A3D31_07395 [Candidatus Fluviicola riflensis]OGS87204.1 MAG: hypothetical protein A2724_06855 [Fluviicola sp. RIFCSPHIGHO2_01_FULL_43_53]OGS89992.1 MAG: hypothetical protein A3E30_03600 [Fluviicola sp. RIFCSPHIGHO2_12_FULL_43_24]
MKPLIILLFVGFTVLNMGCNQRKEKGFACANKDQEIKVSKQKSPVYFKKNCAACHLFDKNSTGPALQGMMKRLPNREWLLSYLQNEDSLIRLGDSTAIRISKRLPAVRFHRFPGLTNRQLDELIQYSKQ